MAATRLGSLGTASLVDGADAFAQFVPRVLDTSVEADTQLKDYGAHTFEKGYVYVSAHTGGFNLDVTFRDDGADSTNIVVSASGTGVTEDTTGSESPVANSLVNWALYSQGMHGDNVTSDSFLISEQGGVAGLVGGDFPSIFADAYISLWSADNTSTAADSFTRLHRATAFSNLRGIIDTAVTGDFAHYDGVKSSNLVASWSSENGAKEDTTGTESNGDGDDISLFWDHGSGASVLLIGHMDTDTDENSRGWSGSDHTYGTTEEHIPILNGEYSSSTTDTSGVTKHAARIGAEDVANLLTRITAFTSATSPVFAISVNGTTSTNVTIAVTGTGNFEDTTSNETLADADEIGFAQSASAVSGVTATIGMVEIPSTAAGGVAGIRSMRQLVGHGQGTRD